MGGALLSGRKIESERWGAEALHARSHARWGAVRDGRAVGGPLDARVESARSEHETSGVSDGRQQCCGRGAGRNKQRGQKRQGGVWCAASSRPAIQWQVLCLV
jgi:hypothetical protein